MNKGCTLAEFFSTLSGGNRKSAFTLAEVLITLGIIGIVAAMTLPALVNNNRNKQLETGLKRSYSIIGQALNMYQAETGEKIRSGEAGIHTLKPTLMKYMKVIKDCGFGRTDSDSACIPNTGEEESNSKVYKTYNNKTIYLPLFDDGQFVLNDGTLILLENGSLERIYISVDVNGFKKRPNRLGQDLFMFQLDEKGVLRPMGAEGTAYYSKNDSYCSVTSSNNLNGAGCTYKALTDTDYFKNLPK